MYRIFVVLGILLCSFLPIQAQSTVAVSKIDSLNRLFDAAKDDAAKINVLVKAPQRIDEYYEKPAAILRLYNKAFKLAESLGDRESLIPLLMEMAHLQMNALADEPKSFQLYLEALKYAEEEKDYESCAEICYDLGVISEHQNFMAEMYKYLFKSVEYAEKSPIIFLKPYQGLKIMFLEEGRVNEALSICQKCIKHVEKRKSTVINTFYAYGYLLEVLNKLPDKKQEVYVLTKKIDSLLVKIKNVKLHYLSVQDIALVCYEAQKYDLTIYYAGQIFKKSDKNRRVEIEQELCAKLISDSYEKQKKYKESLQFHKLYTQISTRNSKDMVSLESGRKVIRAEGERNLLLKQNEIDKERFYRNISFAIAAFIVVLGAIIFIFYRREQARKAELQHLNATKDKLFAILSHDLRSPVGNLENNVMLTNWGALSQEEFIQSIQSLGREIGQVRNMLDNVLHWSISQMGGMKPTLTTTLILPIVETQMKLLLPNAEAKGVKMTNTVLPATQFTVDSNHLAIIVRNLLQNAIKFTPTGGEVSLRNFEKGGQVGLEIKDTGMGITQDRLRNLFTINKDTSQQGIAQEQGTGLGLVLVKELVEANSGTIQVRSEADKGSTFSITFRRV